MLLSDSAVLPTLSLSLSLCLSAGRDPTGIIGNGQWGVGSVNKQVPLVKRVQPRPCVADIYPVPSYLQ